MGWSITSNKSYSLGTIDDNGLATFSEHTEDIVYTVTYSDGNYTCSNNITVYACRPDCLCENVDLRAEATAGGNSIPAVGYDTDTVIGTFDDTTCLSSLTVSSNHTWVKDVDLRGHNVYAKVDSNESIVSARTATITITGKDGENVDCPDDFIITQQMSASTCTCENVDLRAEATAGGNSIPAEGYNTDTLVGTYDNGTCLTSIGVGKDPSKTWITSLSVSNGNVYAKIDPNISLELSRDAIITVSGKDAYDVTCTDDFPITQEKSAVTCTCNEFTVSPREGCVPVSAGTNNIGTYTDGGCVTDIAAYNLPDWLSSVNFSNGTISGTVTKNEGTVKREATISVSGSAAGDTCTRDLYICQDPGECVTGYSASLSNMNVSCLEVDGVRQNFTLTTTTLVNGVCTTNTTPYSDKKVYFVADGQGAVIPRNDSTSTVTTPITLWYNPNTNQFFSFNHNNVSVQVNGGGFSVTQAAGPCCSPGTDDYTMGSEHHILDVSQESGRTVSDTNRCGFDLNKCNISHYSGDRFVSWTIVSSTQIDYVTTSANPYLTSRIEMLKITTTATSVGDCGLPICSEWFVEIRQAADICGCHRVNMGISGHLGGAIGSTATVTWNAGGCNSSDESDWYWCDSSGNRITNPPSWIDEDSYDWYTDQGWVKYIAREENNTGAVRVAYARFEIFIYNPNTGQWEDCGHTVELYQDPK